MLKNKQTNKNITIKVGLLKIQKCYSHRESQNVSLMYYLHAVSDTRHL